MEFDLLADHRQRRRTSDDLERLHQEIRRNVRVVRIFPNKAACLRLLAALSMETSDDWEMGQWQGQPHPEWLSHGRGFATLLLEVMFAWLGRDLTC